jgi:hypothetical protein
MIPEFDRLSGSEMELMFKAPILACILIAGADNDIDNKEIRGALTLANNKHRKGKAKLMSFYQIVNEDFEDKLKITIQSYPIESTQRTPLIVEELAALNSILPKIEKSFANEFVISLRELAMGIAQSSGGILGLKSIGSEEAQFVNLPMIKDPS